MIGRFSHLGTYHELLQSRDFLRASFAGTLALASFLWDNGNEGASTIGLVLAALSVGINGLPIIWGAVRGVLERRVNVDELVSLATVRELHSLGMKHVGLLSGDHRKSASLVAETVGLTYTWAEMKPEDKLGVIHELQGEGRNVIFVGDGINDAPALAAANVGIAMGAAGTDVALDTADVALMNDDVANVAFLVKLSRRMIAIIKINLAFGLAFNALAVLAGGGGYLSPVMGALVHNIGSVLVVLSSASLAFYQNRPKKLTAS
jgi:cation transport ATPase